MADPAERGLAVPSSGSARASSQRYTEFGDARGAKVFGRPELSNVRLIDLEHSGSGPSRSGSARCPLSTCEDQRLRLGRNQTVGATAVEELVADPRWGSLRFLDLEYTGLSDADVERLAGCAHLAGLEHLALSKNALSDRSVEALVQGPLPGGLRSLELAETDVGDRGARALAGCAALAGLRSLRLDSTDVNDDGARALADSPPPSGWSACG
ncbi:MAG: hypothetical protein R3F62_12830 [Planctomycetota bacterium]